MLQSLRQVSLSTCLAVSLLSLSPLAQAEDSGAAAAAAARAVASALGRVSSSMDGLRAIVQQVLGEVSAFKNDFRGVNGMSAAGYANPSVFRSSSVAGAKSDAGRLLALLEDQESFKDARKMSEAAIVDYLTTPFTDVTCNNCEKTYDILPAQSLYKQFFSLNVVNPYNVDIGAGRSQQGRMAPIAGYLIKEGRDGYSQGKFGDTNALMADSLFGPRAFKNEKEGDATLNDSQMAQKYIELSGGLLTPFAHKDFLPSAEFRVDRVVPRDHYLMRVYNYVARESLGMSNLYQIFGSRLTTNGKSAVQAEYDSATRRLKPEWHDEMEKAAPLTVAREMIYLMAEMNYQMYQQRRMNERMLATMSMIQLQILEQTREQIETMYK